MRIWVNLALKIYQCEQSKELLINLGLKKQEVEKVVNELKGGI